MAHKLTLTEFHGSLRLMRCVLEQKMKSPHWGPEPGIPEQRDGQLAMQQSLDALLIVLDELTWEEHRDPSLITDDVIDRIMRKTGRTKDQVLKVFSTFQAACLRVACRGGVESRGDSSPEDTRCRGQAIRSPSEPFSEN